MTLRVPLLAAIAAALVPFAAAFGETPIEFPARKSGYWEINMVHQSATPAPTPEPAMVVHACIDTVTDAQMMQAGLSMTKGMCEKNDMTRDGSTIVIESVCTMGPMKTTSHTVVSGDFQSAYTVKITGTVDGMPAIAGGGKGPMKTAMTQNAKWLGDKCPDGVKPGDMQMPGGMTINTNDMFKAMGGAGKAEKPGEPAGKK